MAEGNIVQIAPLMREPGMMEIKIPQKIRPDSNGAKICGMDVGSTTGQSTRLPRRQAKSLPRLTSGTIPSRRKKSCSSWHASKPSTASRLSTTASFLPGREPA